MENQTVFIKRFPSKGELPSKDGLYFTNLTNLGCYYFYTKHNKWEGLQPEWWLEEIELPSEEEVDLEVDKASSAEDSNEYNGGLDVGYHRCYEFILNKLKGE